MRGHEEYRLPGRERLAAVAAVLFTGVGAASLFMLIGTLVPGVWSTPGLVVAVLTSTGGASYVTWRRRRAARRGR